MVEETETREKKPKRRGTRKIGIIILILGLAVLLYYPVQIMWGLYDQRGEQENLRRSLSQQPFNQSLLDSMQNAAEAEKLRQLALDYRTKLSTGVEIGQLEIPKIGVNVILVEGTGEESLSRGPGHLEETVLPGMGGNFGVAGDRVLYGAPFLNLDEVAVGDEIKVTMPYGTFEYTVVSSIITDPENTGVLQPQGYESITLITCDPPWNTSHRLIVSGKLVKASLPETAAGA